MRAPAPGRWAHTSPERPAGTAPRAGWRQDLTADSIRKDIDINELLTLTNGIVLAASRLPGGGGERALHLVDFVVSGIRTA